VNALDDAVVEGLYEAAAGLRPRNIALAALNDTPSADGSQLVVVDKSNGSLVASEQPAHAPIGAVLDYIREYHRSDPHAAFVAAGLVGEGHTATK
jgi:hypothetical protein